MFNHPLIDRYASKEMVEVFSEERKFKTWRELWIALAEGEKMLGLPITDEQIEEMKRAKDILNLDRARELERELKHDVMAHINAYGELCPKAKPIIHLGATSCYVTDNTDIILMRDALGIIKKRMVNLMQTMKEKALEYKELPCLGHTHLQPAQPVTLGKRICLWLNDLVIDFKNVEFVESNIKFRGVKGTTGTQDSFLKLFNGDEEKVKRLDEFVAKKFGFEESFIITGQTYTRKQDFMIAQALVGIASTCHKIGLDIRVLMANREVEEPWGDKQVGSSAMPYKKNPMKSERMCSLARYAMTLLDSFSYTHALQFFERTLDDSAIRRITIPELFMCIDAVLILADNIIGGLKINKKVIEKRLNEELPFIAIEEILMKAVKLGGDRQKLHEKLRRYAYMAYENVIEGKNNNLLELIAEDPEFMLSKEEIIELLKHHRFIGRSASQVEEFIEKEVNPIIEKHKSLLGEREIVRV
ncbi:MAG: adenylosuccinate lyase [Thermosulfidibacteraceae bacterium]